jgi:hypothetical protein
MLGGGYKASDLADHRPWDAAIPSVRQCPQSGRRKMITENRLTPAFRPSRHYRHHGHGRPRRQREPQSPQGKPHVARAPSGAADFRQVNGNGWEPAIPSRDARTLAADGRLLASSSSQTGPDPRGNPKVMGAGRESRRRRPDRGAEGMLAGASRKDWLPF